MTECYSYISRAKIDLDPVELSKIIVNSRSFNANNAITGLLLYDGTMFYQYIEGPAEPLADARLRIEQSKNHSDIQVMLDGAPRNPGAFSTWSLGYLVLDEPAYALHAFVLPADHAPDHAQLVGVFNKLAAKADVM